MAGSLPQKCSWRPVFKAEKTSALLRDALSSGGCAERSVWRGPRVGLGGPGERLSRVAVTTGLHHGASVDAKHNRRRGSPQSSGLPPLSLWGRLLASRCHQLRQSPQATLSPEQRPPPRSRPRTAASANPALSLLVKVTMWSFLHKYKH